MMLRHRQSGAALYSSSGWLIWKAVLEIVAKRLAAPAVLSIARQVHSKTQRTSQVLTVNLKFSRSKWSAS